MFIPTPPEPESDAKYGSESARAYAVKLLQSGTSPGAVRQKLLKFGLNEQAASKLLADIESGRTSEDLSSVDPNLSVEELEKKMRKEAAQKKMGLGALICVAGLAVTGITYMLATEAGMGIYVVAWGAIIFGAIQLLQGASQAS